MPQLVQRERLHRCWLGSMKLLIGGTWLFASELRASTISPRVFFCLLSSPPPLSVSDGSSSLAIFITYKTAANLPRFSGMTTPYKLLSHIDKQWLIRLEQSPPLQDFRFSENISSVAVVRSTWFLDWPLVTRYFKLKMNFVFCLCFVGPLLSPQESVALLTQAGLFDNAFTVASHFNLPKETIFEGLASRYGSTSPSSNLTFENRSHLAKHFFLTSKPSWCHSLEKLLVLFLYFFVS